MLYGRSDGILPAFFVGEELFGVLMRHRWLPIGRFILNPVNLILLAGISRTILVGDATLIQVDRLQLLVGRYLENRCCSCSYSAKESVCFT